MKGGGHFFWKLAENNQGQGLNFWNLYFRWELEKSLKLTGYLKVHKYIGHLTSWKMESKISWIKNLNFYSWGFNNSQQIIWLRKPPLTVKKIDLIENVSYVRILVLWKKVNLKSKKMRIFGFWKGEKFWPKKWKKTKNA